jgi:hypothetical protein
VRFTPPDPDHGRRNGFLAAALTLFIGLTLPGASARVSAADAEDPVMSGAHARYSKAQINNGPSNLTLTLALVTAGGGATAFDAQKLVGTLTGNGAVTQKELASLTKKFGADNVDSFVKTFDFVVTDALAQVAKDGIALPAAPLPDPGDGKALSSALYAAGVTPRGKYDVEYMLDTLVSHPIHVQVMNDIDANPDLGPKADANYHLVFAQTMMDLKAAYAL